MVTSAENSLSPLTLGEVQVRGTNNGTLPGSHVLSSVDILSGDVLHGQRVDYAWELFMRAPGVQVTQFRMGTEAGRFSFRGFNGEGRINAVKLLIDGIPSNDNLGGIPYLDALSPLGISAIQIVRGTNDPRYGLNAIAGYVDVITHRGGNDSLLSVTTGDFGTREVQLAKGIERGAWRQNYVASWSDSDGYRDHARAIKRSFSGQWGYVNPSDAWDAGLSMRYFHNNAQEAGYLSYSDAVAYPRSSPPYAGEDHSQRQTMQTALHLDADVSEAWHWSTKAYINRYTNDRVVQFTATSTRQERYTDETHRGMLTNAIWRPRVDWAQEFSLEGGLEGQWQSNVSRRYRISDCQRSTVLRDWDFNLDTYSAYLQAEIRVNEPLKLVPAYRIDRVYGWFGDILGRVRYPVYGYGTIQQPKFSVSYDLSHDVTAYANWGRTFQIGSGNGAYRIQTDNLAPSINDGWETGFTFKPWSWANARLAYWQQRASGEVATILGVNGTVATHEVGNVGKTLRKGWDAQLDLHLSEPCRLWLAYSRQKAEIVTPDPSAPATRGKEVENVPRWLASVGVEWHVLPKLKLSAWGNGQGDYYVERSNTLGRYGGYVLGNLSATWELRNKSELALQLKNIANRFYVYAWYDSGFSGYSPGDGRALYLTWTLTF
ncbi:MAG TPA: TonB-dependent receptor [Xylella sp.]